MEDGDQETVKTKVRKELSSSVGIKQCCVASLFPLPASLLHSLSVQILPRLRVCAQLRGQPPLLLMSSDVLDVATSKMWKLLHMPSILPPDTQN